MIIFVWEFSASGPVSTPVAERSSSFAIGHYFACCYQFF
jgi:hypothetical protein